MAHEDVIRDAAIDWAVRTGDPAFDDWDGFTQWLERDPAHAAAYDRVSAAIADAVDADLPPAAAAETTPARDGVSRRWWLGGALAASLAVVGVGVWQTQGERGYIETAPGEMRTIALADGGSVAMGGGTRLRLDPRDPRAARLDHGQALFTIHHDDARPFRLDVGGDRIVDVGTVFDVKRGAATTHIAVSEGAVVFNPDRQNVRLDPGQRFAIDDGATHYRLSDIAIPQVGEWRTGRLTFHDATLGEIADDLARATGLAFEVAPGARSQRLTGSLAADAVRRDPAGVGRLLDVAVRRQGERWILGSP